MPKYEIDPHNRLIVQGKRKSNVSRYRVSLDGYFKTDKKNRLRYHVKSPYHTDIPDTPHRIVLNGTYSLTKNHDLRLRLSRSRKQRSRDTLLLKGDIVFVKENELGFSVYTRNSDGSSGLRTLSLTGKWALDKKNRLSFLVKRELGKYDAITLTGRWTINKTNEIEYSYKKKILKRKINRVKKLLFKGRWAIFDKSRIDYMLGGGKGSGFEFKASLAGTGLVKRRRVIIYKLGTHIKTKTRYIKIFGRWRVTPSTGLVFEVTYSKGRRNLLSYGAEIKLGKRNDLIFHLKDKKNKPLGIEISIKRRFLKNTGEALLKLRLSNKEQSIVISAGRLF